MLNLPFLYLVILLALTLFVSKVDKKLKREYLKNSLADIGSPTSTEALIGPILEKVKEIYQASCSKVWLPNLRLCRRM